jgi:hypothetical protein
VDVANRFLFFLILHLYIQKEGAGMLGVGGEGKKKYEV